MLIVISTITLLGIFIEALIYTGSFFWKYRIVLTGSAILLNLTAAYGFIIYEVSFISFLVVFLMIFRLINLFRIKQARMHDQYLKKVTSRTWLIISAWQVLVLTLLVFVEINTETIVLSIAIFQLLVSLGLATTTFRNLYKTRYLPTGARLADSQLPTVTVAIPARNETVELEECLTSVLANNYPKLEVIVLDDCSSDKTPEIIRSFAHDGVRFIKGDTIDGNWLAKNQAYDKLADNSSGEFILFCSVNVRFGTDSIQKLVNSMLSKNKQMMCVMATNNTHGVFATLIQPLLNWWELALPRRMFNRPPVFSSCWMINRRELLRLGGFESVHRMVVPEGFFARELVINDKYSLIRSNSDLGITTQNTAKEQLEKSIRIRYPQIRRRPELAMLILLFELALLVMPLAILILGFWNGFSMSQVLSGTSYIILVITHVLIVQISNPNKALYSLFNLPFITITEIYVGCLSMLKYEFSLVVWKDRNICIPVMHKISTSANIKPLTSNSHMDPAHTN